ncbi:MAG: hypothetical protein EOO77_10010 [Oxalobacteraceae bacterium]|nr:MAG: hypothetical protein EOO77_10010 [Oxalobacteraceae bacterium]
MFAPASVNAGIDVDSLAIAWGLYGRSRLALPIDIVIGIIIGIAFTVIRRSSPSAFISSLTET